jgi:hypothetical protein
MRRFVLLIALLSLAFTPAPFPKLRRSDDRADRQGMQGKWEGVPGPLLKIIGDHMVFSSDYVFKFALDAKAAPRRIQGIGVVSRLDGKAFWGVYHLDKDKLTICWRWGSVSQPGWPTSFDPAQKDVWLQVYQRVKR